MPGVWRRELLSAAQRVDIDRQCFDGGRVETAGPRWHHAGAAVGNSLDDRRFVRSIEPDFVGQVGSARFLIALACVAVTGDAVFGEYLLARSGIVPRTCGQSRQ